MFEQKFFVDQLDDVQVEVDGVEIEQRHAEFVGGGNGDLPSIRKPVGDEVRHQVRALALDGAQGRYQIGLGNDAVLDESARQAGEGTLGCGDGHESKALLGTFDNKRCTFTVGSGHCQSNMPGFVIGIRGSIPRLSLGLSLGPFVTGVTIILAGAGTRRIASRAPCSQNPPVISQPATVPAGGRRERKLVLAALIGFALLALASYGFSVYDLSMTLPQDFLAYILIDRDFANYWVAGRLVLSGEHLDLFAFSTYFPHLQALFGSNIQIRAWSYPPHFLLFVWPLGLVGYKTGIVAFLGGTLLLFAWAVATFRREFAPLAGLRVLLLALFGYVLMMLVAAQNGFLTATFILLGLAWMRRRPLLAGLAFACLTIKPQLGLLIPVLLVFDRNWATLAWSAIFTALLVAASALVFGLESWEAYLTDTLAYQRFVMTDWQGIFLRMMPTVFGSMRTLGFSPALAGQAQVVVSVCAFAAVLWLLHRERDRLRRAFVVTCGTFLITPYAFNYDMGALCACAALLAGDRQSGVSRPLFVLPIAIAAASAAAVTNLGRANVPCTPLVLAAALAALVAAARERPVSRLETLTSAPSDS